MNESGYMLNEFSFHNRGMSFFRARTNILCLGYQYRCCNAKIRNPFSNPGLGAERSKVCRLLKRFGSSVLAFWRQCANRKFHVGPRWIGNGAVRRRLLDRASAVYQRATF